MFAEKIKVASGLLDSNPAFVGGTDIEWSGYFAFFFFSYPFRFPGRHKNLTFKIFVFYLYLEI